MIENAANLKEVESAVEEEFREFFKASDINGELEKIKRTAHTLDHMSDSDEYNLHKLSSHPRIFSTTNYPELPQEVMEKTEEEFRKSVKVIRKNGKASKTEITEISSHYSDANSLNAKLEYEGKLADNLDKHPQIEYNNKEEVYRWRE